ncbi:DUF3958 family protein [uncultured Enterococcus sp.]|uniref:DUF3958 family protein n=1 Tax=uncultured Enterococcus sp. TaxID=167972 RepID=UPI002AA768D3|nr:DUF3958 family protein [uncultured Enterococcus sp.]
MGITIEEEQINQQLSKVEINQELNRKQQWRLEELEQDYQRLSMQHESFLSGILQTTEDERMKHYFLSEEDEVRELHRQNFFELEREQDELKQEEKQLSVTQDELLWERKRIAISKEDEKEKKDGA